MTKLGYRNGVLATVAFLLVVAFPASAAVQRDSGQAIERTQQEVRDRLMRSEGQDVDVRFNDDANQQFQSNREFRVTGTGEVRRRDQRRSFYYQATVNDREGNVLNLRTDWRGGWVSGGFRGDGRGPGGGGRPDGGFGGRPDGGGGGGRGERPNGRVRFSGPITNVETGKVLDVRDFSREDGGTVQQWSYANQRNQRWDVVEVARGDVAILNQNSGLVLDVGGFSNRNGGDIQQYRWTSADNQRWRLEPVGRGSFRIVNANSGKCLDVDQKSRENGARIHQWDCNGDRSQQWRLGN